METKGTCSPPLFFTRKYLQINVSCFCLYNLKRLGMEVCSPHGIITLHYCNFPEFRWLEKENRG